MKERIFIALLAAHLLGGCHFIESIFGTSPEPNPVEQADSLTLDLMEKEINKKFSAITLDSKLPDVNIRGYGLPNSYISSAPFLVGKLVRIDTSKVHTELTWIGDFNYLISPEKLTNEIVNNKPYFDSYVERGVATDVSAVKMASMGLQADESMHVTYETILSSVPKGEFLDKARIDDDANVYKFRKYENLGIINSVTVNRLSYTKFRKFTGSITGSSSIVNLNGNMYYKSGDELNSWELYVTISTVPLKANGVADTLNIAPENIHTLIKVQTTKKTLEPS